MSTCPDSDIISVYFDGELPLAYKAQIESHFAACKVCRERYQRYAALKKMCAEDAQHSALTEDECADSYKRLLSRMKFRCVTEQSPHIRLSAVKYTLPAIAAAAVFALILPLRITHGIDETYRQTMTASAQKATLMKNRGIIIDGNVPHTTLASLFKDSRAAAINTLAANRAEQTAEKEHTGIPQTVYAHTIAEQTESNRYFSNVDSIDIFKPDFFAAQNRFPVNISIYALPAADRQIPAVPFDRNIFHYHTPDPLP
ncbi:MAG: hypothetical protein NC041_07515 [Bacteroides sp.]|nr:hypothetical protein [Prevotella sp.]MCM1407147.1 hypothetical protein [Treponema brennaborense]MCM1470299.1 hypothetical protein [Bacteroides sp.]